MQDGYGNYLSWIPNIEASKVPIYIALAECIKQDILIGRLEGGFRMPPQRILANYLNLNHSTVTRAYKLCEESGLLKGITGKGTFVSIYAQLPNNVLSDIYNSNIIDMGMLHPLNEVNDMIEMHVKYIYDKIDYTKILQYAPPEGFPHQKYIFEKWLQGYQIEYKADQIIITSGIQNAISIILAGVFKKGDRILVDEVTYTGFTNLAKMFGVMLIPVSTGMKGIDIEELRYACKREAPQGIYLVTDCHNPTSITLSRETRAMIADIIRENNMLLIEDDPFGFITYKGIPPISSLIPERSFFITGTSKSISPSFRIAILGAPSRYIANLTNTLNHMTWSASSINAEVITQLITSNKYKEISDKKLDLLRERNKLMEEMLIDFDLIPSETSFLRMLKLHEHISDKDIENHCLRRGVQVFSSKRFSVSIQPHINAIRLSVSGPQSCKELKSGLEILIKTMNELKNNNYCSII